ncbi:MAG TPA: hypothetical protein VLT59_10725 [Steroidobacteraceae bacterium]|nr:hypothetical protein [Steroidobacteraceae bacterium]
MSELIGSGRIVDLILAFVVLEAVALALLRRWRPTAPPFADLLASLVPGAFLLLALRSALLGSGWVAIAAFLTGALLTHLYDLFRRFDGHRADRRS